jgi:uncharacterized metal-binding protein YceD (DUF177 family)
MSIEFSRPQGLNTIGTGESVVEVAADAAERAALAVRFGLVGIKRLDAKFALRRDSAGISASGHLSAAVTQACVVTQDPIHVVVEENFAIRFVPEPSDAFEEVELAPDDVDTILYTGNAIDLGEAAAETMALALDPFPRSPAAEEALREAGVLREEDVTPLNAFASLKDKLGG